MWLCHIYDQDGRTTGKLIREEIIIGRAEDCDICILNDKSISRKHLKLCIIGDDAYVTELGSKFGTKIDGIDCKKDDKIRLKEGQIIQIGISGSKVTLQRYFLNLCPTKLDKQEKEKLKNIVKSINAKTVKTVSECTHLLCNRFTATLKVVTAIALGKPIITTDALHFLQNNTAHTIPVPNWEK